MGGGPFGLKRARTLPYMRVERKHRELLVNGRTLTQHRCQANTLKALRAGYPGNAFTHFHPDFTPSRTDSRSERRA